MTLFRLRVLLGQLAQLVAVHIQKEQMPQVLHSPKSKQARDAGLQGGLSFWLPNTHTQTKDALKKHDTDLNVMMHIEPTQRSHSQEENGLN